MTVALAGRRVDADDAETSRFPATMIEVVRQRLRRLLCHVDVKAIVCSAACGADLLALDVGGDCGLRRRIVLPFTPDRFRTTSVTDRPGDWGALFDRIVDEVGARRELIVLEAVGSDDEAYAAANRAILDQAVLLSKEHPARFTAAKRESDVLAVAVWDGSPRGEGDLTDEFLNEARRRGLPTIEIATL